VLEKATQFEFGGIRPLAQQKAARGFDLLQHWCSNFAAKIRRSAGLYRINL
jgi:hypothetical protein